MVPSPRAQRIVQLDAIARLIDAGFLVICTGGGGSRSSRTQGRQRGVEAVIDKDLASALLASDLRASRRSCWPPTSTPSTTTTAPAAQRPIAHATPAGLRSQ